MTMQLTTKTGERNRVHICRPDDLNETYCGVGQQEWAWEEDDDIAEAEIPALCKRCSSAHYHRGDRVGYP
ncbi:MAG: hypothetical protein GY906_10345 [bacterium]|nr:hypothetical protein [bacterium]